MDSPLQRQRPRAPGRACTDGPARPHLALATATMPWPPAPRLLRGARDRPAPRAVAGEGPARPAGLPEVHADGVRAQEGVIQRPEQLLVVVLACGATRTGRVSGAALSRNVGSGPGARGQPARHAAPPGFLAQAGSAASDTCLDAPAAGCAAGTGFVRVHAALLGQTPLGLHSLSPSPCPHPRPRPHSVSPGSS